MAEPAEPLLSSTEAHAEERRHIRLQRDDGASKDSDDFIGLAFSGGGIRSATFNLGLLQALARHDLLRHFDYLSTVSGGGYIGAWFSALILRHGGLEPVRQLLADGPGAAAEAPPIRFLRRYSRYLTPTKGLSGDTCAAVATYLRNFALNLIPLTALVSGIIVAFILATVIVAHLDPTTQDTAARVSAPLLIMLAVACAAMGLRTTALGSDDARPTDPAHGVSPAGPARRLFAGGNDPARLLAAQPRWAWTILVPMFGAALALAIGVGDASAGGWLPAVSAARGDWMLLGALAYGAAWIVGYAVWALPGVAGDTGRRLAELPLFMCLTLAAGAVGGLLLQGVLHGLATWQGGLARTVASPLATNAPTIACTRAWFALCLGAPLVVLVFLATVALHIGLLNRTLSHEAREWWSRLGGLALFGALAWALAFALVGLSPALRLWAQHWTMQAGGTWAVVTGAGLWLAKSPLTGGEPGGKRSRVWLEAAMRIVPYVFLGGLIVGLSLVVHQVALGIPGAIRLGAVDGHPLFELMLFTFADVTRLDPSALAAGVAACIAVFLFAAWRIDINLFSLHHFYRNRLLRAYLGASNFPDRKKHPFTGFCADDDVRLGKLRDQRPFHVLNAALNLSGGDELAWQTRRAASFTFTPLHCGYEYLATRTTQDDDGQRLRTLGGYRPTLRYQSRWGAFLGTAMSISGAAASPLCGYHTSAPLAALMTIFNVRLGQWLGNPTDAQAWQTASPRFGARYLLKELTATANAEASYLYLSDGGHFENLGLYELVRRRCRLIVAGDAACDPTYAFDDLANAIRKCSIDLGAEIAIDVDALRPRDGFRHTGAHHASGTIRYADGSVGTLLYVKASLTGDEGPALLNHATGHPSFPHDTTADQWFDEDQFESYRSLGLHIGDALFGELRRTAAAGRLGTFDAATFIDQVAALARPAPAA